MSGIARFGGCMINDGRSARTRELERPKDDEPSGKKPNGNHEPSEQHSEQKPAEDGDETPDDAAKSPPMPRWKKLLYWVIGLVVLTALIIGGVLYYLHARQFETTDDAFIDGHISQMASQVSGRVIQLAVADNQQVEAGQLLVQIDPRDYQVKLDQARAQRANNAAQLEQAQAQLGVRQADIDQADANIRVSEADLFQAQQDFNRYRAIDPKAISKQQYDNASATTRSATAKLDANKQAAAGARAQLEAARATVTAAAATVQQSDSDIANAQLQLSYTRIVAPEAGRVTRRTVELGNYISPGQALLAVVPNNMWVTANFKETQLNHMRDGQPVEIQVDAYPDAKLHGHVDSFQTGTGSAFSSLPAENATGNYVKVVQRVPVKIVFDGDDAQRLRLGPGMSVAPRVTIR